MFKKILLIVIVFILFSCIADLIINAASKSKTHLRKSHGGQPLHIYSQENPLSSAKKDENIVETANEGYDDQSYY
ncbi:MAG: hypothetical protein AMJ43_03385 [Coxiella sp. DG_40]|nr:MAG: hypothetical protein AMJ43_03385 [Coxiella sp. DG_40]